MLLAAAGVALTACGHNTPQPSEPPLHPALQVVCRGHVPGHFEPVWSLHCPETLTRPRQVSDCC
jgi:hypothetical protein